VLRVCGVWARGGAVTAMLLPTVVLVRVGR
jgi:hypothetical protein